MDLECLTDLLPRVQALVIWIDQRFASRRPEFKRLVREQGQHLHLFRILDASQKWKGCSGWIWREPLMRALDDVQPAYVLQPDSDEKFAPGFEADFRTFRESGRDLLLFDYDMPTIDGAWVPTVPAARHVKAIRWRSGLAFSPYRGYGRPNGQLSEAKAASKILHYAFFTPELQAAKVAKFSEARQAKFSRRLDKPPCT
jgi:hypothetical protein